LNAAQTTYNDLNSGNYAGAWNTALGTSSMFGTNMGAQTTDPLLQALESSQGLQAFDPTKKWDASSLDAYYAAFNSTGAYHGNNTGTNGYLGQNPYGNWGAASAITSGSDQAANLSQEGATPDVARFVGARPTKSFLGKYGADIGMLALAVAAPYAVGALAPEIAGGAAIASGGATGAATGAIGSIGAGALVGAGGGAALGALSGGNVGKDALLGGLTGGIGAGASTLGSYYGVPGAASSLAGKVGSNLATGAVQGSGGGNVGNINGAVTGGQGNNGNMASTDSSLAGTISGALPGVLQAGAGIYGSQNAAQAMTGAEANAIGTQQSTLGNIGNIWSTQQNLGQGAQTQLGAALGTNGQPANYSNFMNMPGYQFAVSQGTQAVQRQAAAMGNAYTPNTAAAIGQYVTGTASQDYNTYINQLMGAAGLGSTANAGIATPTYQTGANISTLQQNQGYAQASGVSGASNAVGGLFNPSGAGTSLVGAAAKYLGGSNGTTTGNPNNLGGSTPTAPPGQTLQYDANGNIIGSADTSQFAGSANYGASDTSGASTDWLTGGTNFLGGP
jgi:hypothetical protein